MLSEQRQGAAKAAATRRRRSSRPLKPLPDDALIIIPMRNTVLFPGVITPITVGRIQSVTAAQEAVRSEKKIGFLLQRDPQTNDVQPADLYWVGTAGQVVRYITGAEGTHHLVVQGQSRFRVLEFLARLAVPRRARADGFAKRGFESRDRGALPAAEGAGDRGDRPAAERAGRARAWWCRA